MPATPPRDASGKFIKVSMRGEIETQKRLVQAVADLKGQPMKDAMTTATLLVERDAKIGAPVDMGILRASLTHELRVSGLGKQQALQGVVGSAKPQALWMEMGTGLPAGHARVKFPPPSAFEVWARRHGFASGYIVARAIWKRGGLEPRRYLQKAFDKNRQAIISLIGDAVAKISQKANGT